MLGRSLRPHVRATSSAFRSTPRPYQREVAASAEEPERATLWPRQLEATSPAPGKIDDEMSGDLEAQDTQLSAWTSALPSGPGPFKRLLRVLLSLVARPSIVPGYDEGEPPSEGAGVPARPKRPAPTRLAAAELELPRESN